MIRCQGIGWDAGEKTVLDGITFEVQKGESFGLIGPSGGGKSSLIRILDLLVRPTRGRLWIGDEEVTGGFKGIIAMRRRMAMVFQRPAAFRMSVSENIGYGLALRGVPRGERKNRVSEALYHVGLGGFEDRRASTLSGGELQRVSIARCLVTDPEVLFLDEPTANLDPLSTTVIENVVAGLRKDRGITVVMATHNLEQGQRLCDRLAVLAGGCLVQTGTPVDIFYEPKSLEVARFVGAENLVEGVVERMDRGVAFVRTGQATLAVAVHAPIAGPVTVAIRSEEVEISKGTGCRPGTFNHLHGTVTAIDSAGPLVRVELDAGFPLVALIRRLSYRQIGLESGMTVCVEFDPNSAHLIPRARSSKVL